MNKLTRDLIKLVERQAGDTGSYIQAQTLVNAGADIRAHTKDGPMIYSVINEEQRQRPVVPWKADNCLRLIEVLQKQASRLLAAQVLSPDGSDINEIRRLIQLYASTYQSETFGALGLLGDLLKQGRTLIQLEIVKILIESDPNTHAGLTAENDAEETCLSIARANPKCSREVIDYLQHEFDKILNKIPFSQSPINTNEVINWIRRGANTEMADEKGNTVLLNAVLTNNLELVHVLVSYGCNTSHVNAEKFTSLDIARKATPKNARLIGALEAQSVNMELRKLIETKKSHITTAEVSALLSSGANINALIADNSSLLHLLIANNGTSEMITAFVNEFNADITIIDTRGHRAIETCILTDEKPFAALKTFLKLSKVTTAMFFNSKLNRTLLQFATEQKRTGAADTIQYAMNERLWMCVIENNSIKDTPNENMMIEIKQLIDYGAQINHKHTGKNHQEWTVLHVACQKTNKNFVQFLIEQMKADHLMQNGYGNGPIAIAAEHGNLSILEYLWELPGSTLNVTNKDKETPLHLATKNQHLPVVRFLVQWGVDSQAQDLGKRTALDIAHTNVSNKKEDELNNRKLVSFLEQLICPSVTKSEKTSKTALKKPDVHQDTCELVTAIPIKPIQIGNTDPERRGMTDLGVFSGTPNDNLHKAAREGLAAEAKQAIGQGADICYRKNGYAPYSVALQTAQECYTKLQSSNSNYRQLQTKMQWCQHIASTISEIAQTKLIEAIENSNTGLVVAYHIAGAPLTSDLLYRACSSSDNVEIVHYLIQQSPEILQSIYNYTRPESPYRTAKKKKFYQVALYLKYVLSVECTKAVKENNLLYVKQLVLSGASVDMADTNNLQEAFKHQNIELIHFLCDNGVKMPMEWLESSNIILPVDVAQKMSSDIVAHINRSLINRRLRFAAASGDLTDVIRCQRLGSNINSMNCYGSTAVLCAIQHGNYFSIVHALVSCGASILHCNDDEPMSLIDLAKQNQYDAIANYLTNELNTQFITSILNDDRKSAEIFEELGVDFNYQDEQKRTALHYAVQYHGIDLVTWLCDRRSLPMSADINGDYPIILATEKGDYPVVELFVLNYPDTKKQTNQAGLTALKIAQKLKYRQIVQLIETGKPVSSTDDDKQPQGPKHTVEKLREAAQKGPVTIIREFREDRYDSRDEKRQLCYELLHIAKNYKQFEIIDILEPYYNTDLKPDLPSDIEVGEKVTLNKPNKRVLLGFLTGLGGVIADSPIILDPGDPNTYKSLFSGLTSKLTKRLKQLKQIGNEQDAKKVYQQDSANMDQKLGQITDELQKLEETRKETIVRIQERDEQLSKQKELSALQRKALFEEKIEYEQQLAVYECSISLYQREQEAILNRQKTLKFIKDDTNLYLFYRTIENRLQSLFHSVLAAQSGEPQTAIQTKSSTATGSVKTVSSSALLVFSEVIVSAVKETFTEILSRLNEVEQKQEWYNISTMGNIEEVDRLASDTAGILTLYYKEQIQSIESTSKMTGINPYNDQLKWIKDVFMDVRAETAEEIPVVIVADYVTAWIIDALKVDRKEIKPDKPLPQQLWYLVAKKNLIEQGTSNKVSDVVRVEAGQQKIPLINKKKNLESEESPIFVQLRYLIGCVSIVGLNGEVYQYPVSKRSTEEDFEDLDMFGYVYISPFSSDENILKSIVTERKMKVAVRNNQNDILTKLSEIELHAKVFIHHQGMERASQSYITKEKANQIAQVLREQKMFVNATDLKVELDKARKVVGFSVDALKEDIQKKVEFYQTSINAAHEQIQQESEKNRKTIEKDNAQRYNQAISKLSQELKEMKTDLEKIISQRMDGVEAEMRAKTKEVLTIAQTAKDQADKTLIQATKAAQDSEQSAKKSEENMKYSQELVQSTEQRRQELRSVADKCENMVKATTAEQKELFERNVLEIRARVQIELDHAKQVTTELVAKAKESARAAQEAMSSAKELTAATKQQLEIQKIESKKIVSEAQEARRQSERSADVSREVEKQAKRAVDETTAQLSKVNDMYKKAQEALHRLEKLEKKLESK